MGGRLVEGLGAGDVIVPGAQDGGVETTVSWSRETQTQPPVSVSSIGYTVVGPDLPPFPPLLLPLLPFAPFPPL